MTRALLGLEDVVSMDILFYRRDPERGWQFNADEPGCTEDTAAGGIQHIPELYQRESSQERSVKLSFFWQTSLCVYSHSTSKPLKKDHDTSSCFQHIGG